MSARRLLVKDRRTGLWLGIGLLCAGSYLIWEAYEGRGIDRPFVARFLPGP